MFSLLVWIFFYSVFSIHFPAVPLHYYLLTTTPTDLQDVIALRGQQEVHDVILVAEFSPTRCHVRHSTAAHQAFQR